MREVFEADIECRSCGGTGLYQGMSERNGAAVVCYSCKGTGKERYRMSYTLFTERKIKDGVRRVFKNSAGYCHDADDVTTPEGVLIPFSFCGADYADWLAGAEPKPVKTLYCPYQWTGQAMQSSDHEDYEFHQRLCANVEGRYCGMALDECPKYDKKSECWDFYEEIRGRKEASMTLKPGMEAEWSEFRKINSLENDSSGYSEAVIRLALAWAELAEKEMEEKEVSIERLRDLGSEACKGEGFTGFQAGCAWATLRKFWKYGDQIEGYEWMALDRSFDVYLRKF